MEKALKLTFFFGPLIFAIGFLVPVIAQAMVALGWTPPFGLSPLQFGFAVAGPLGLLAQIRGRWI
ncbi:MAG: hypothetical protein R3265_17455 [Hyphomonas sp.]|nr:hypothetical protein [Hyphomonas sp.]